MKMKAFTSANIFMIVLLGAATIASSQWAGDYYTARINDYFRKIMNKVPNYNVVPIHLPKQPSNTSPGPITIKAFDKNIQLWINPTDGILYGDETPVYSVQMTSTGPKFFIYEDLMKSIAPVLYQDKTGTSTLALSTDKRGRRSITGLIGSDYIIRPLPDHLVHNVTKYRRSVDGIPESEYDDHHYHIIMRTEKSPESIEYLEAPLKPISSKSKRAAQADTVYPEILVIADNSLRKLFSDTNIVPLVLYLLAFWNGVDMKYRELVNPKYRLNIARIIIAVDDTVLQYFAINKWGPEDLNAEAALRDNGIWLSRQNEFIPIDSYDIAATMTKDKLCSLTSNRYENTYECKTLGIAYVGGACVGSQTNQFIKTALIHDNGGYDGINTAAHELGHSLGAEHDGVNQHRRCSFYDGHLMTTSQALTAHNADWSSCSREDFQKFFNSENSLCLYNKPNPGKILPRQLPGMTMTADEQCVQVYGHGYTAYMDGDANICIKLGCLNPTGTQIIAKTSAADGTQCGNERVCLYGKCIAEYQLY